MNEIKYVIIRVSEGVNPTRMYYTGRRWSFLAYRAELYDGVFEAQSVKRSRPELAAGNIVAVGGADLHAIRLGDNRVW